MEGCLFLILLIYVDASGSINLGIIGYNADDATQFATTQAFSKENISFLNISHGNPFQLAQDETKRLIQEQHLLMVREHICNKIAISFNQQRLEKPIVCYRSSSQGLPSQSKYYLPIRQFGSVICQLLQRLQWSRVHIFAEDNDASWGLTTALKADGITSSSTLFNSPSSPELQSMLWKVLRRVLPWHIVVLGRQEAVRHILKEADEFDVRHGRQTDLRSSSSWLVVLPGNNLEVFQNDSWLDNVAVMTLPVVDIRHLVKNPFQGQTGDIFTLMYRQYGREFEHIGRFYVNGNLDVNSNIFPNTNHGLNGRPLLASTLRWPPYTYVRNVSGRIVFEGICIDILKELSALMNFTFKIGFPPDMEWGVQKGDHSWTGLVGQLERKEIDMTVAALAGTVERGKVMDFSYPIGFDIGAAVYRIPDPENSSWQLYLKPLSLYTHLCLGISFLLLVLLLCTTRSCTQVTAGGEGDATDTWLIVFGLMIRQSPYVNQMRASSNILLSFICVFGMLTSAIYSSNMIAFFTVSKEMLPFTTFEEMVQQDTYKWGTLGGSLWSDSFEISKAPIHKQFWQGVVNLNKSDPDVLHGSELVHKKKVMEGKYVFVVETDILETWVQNDCSLKLIPGVAFPMRYSLGLPLNSPYEKVVSDWLLAFSERGLYDVWRRKWMPKNNSCSMQHMMKGKTVTVIDLQSSFYILGIGSSIATVSLMFEIWYGKRQRTRHEHKSEG